MLATAAGCAGPGVCARPTFVDTKSCQYRTSMISVTVNTSDTPTVRTATMMAYKSRKPPASKAMVTACMIA